MQTTTESSSYKTFPLNFFIRFLYAKDKNLCYGLVLSFIVFKAKVCNKCIVVKKVLIDYIIVKITTDNR